MGARQVLAGLPAGWALVALLALLVAEVLAVPGVVLPGGTAVLLAGALVGSGRVDGRVAVPAVVVAVLVADQLAFLVGRHAGRWLRRRLPAAAADEPPDDSAGEPARSFRWWRHFGLAALPSLAGAAQLRYRRFAVRALALRAVWLPVFLSAGIVGGQQLSRVRTFGTGLAVVGGLAVVAVLIARRRRPLARWLAAGRMETPRPPARSGRPARRRRRRA